LKGGQSLPIHTEIQSLSPAEGEMQSGMADTMAPAPSGPPAAGSPASGGGSAARGTSSGSPAANPALGQQQMSNGGAAATASNSGPAAGTVVARTGNIAIRTTSIPGVLLANNEPGQQDPRMAQSSGILLGAKRDIHLGGGTKVVIGVAAAGANPGGN
jgi:hypothetical protein